MKFMRLVSEWLERAKVASSPVIDSVTYGKRRRTRDEAVGVPAVFLKDEEFAYQDEVRIAWRTMNPPPAVMFPEDTEITKLVSPHPLPNISPSGIVGPHAAQLSDEALIDRSYALVDRIIALLSELDTTMKAGMETHRQDRSAMAAVHTNARATLGNGMLNSSSEIDLLLREHLKRGQWDSRIEADATADWSIAYNSHNLAAGLQRLAEHLEFRLTRRPSAPRAMAVSTSGSYLFWLDGATAVHEPESLRRLIREGYKSKLEIRLSDVGSLSRHQWVDLHLDSATREALLWLMNRHQVPPSEVLDYLIKKSLRA